MKKKPTKNPDKRKWLKCEFCEKRKPDTTIGPDPYSQDVNGIDTPCKICADCHNERVMKI